MGNTVPDEWCRLHGSRDTELRPQDKEGDPVWIRDESHEATRIGMGPNGW